MVESSAKSKNRLQKCVSFAPTIYKGKIAHATYHHNHHPSTTDQSATRHSWRFLPKRDNNARAWQSLQGMLAYVNALYPLGARG